MRRTLDYIPEDWPIIAALAAVLYYGGQYPSCIAAAHAKNTTSIVNPLQLRSVIDRDADRSHLRGLLR